MDLFTATPVDTGIRLEGLPIDTVKVVEESGKKARRLADLFLHRHDLSYARDCLKIINEAPHRLMQEALWTTALVSWAKCFGKSGARGQLDARRLYANHGTEAMKAFGFFKSLRNKHVVHDENTFMQCVPGLAINDGTKSYKVEKVIVLMSVQKVLDDETYGSLLKLIEVALEWIHAEFDALSQNISTESEKLSYPELAQRRDSRMRFVDRDQVDRRRSG